MTITQPNVYLLLCQSLIVAAKAIMCYVLCVLEALLVPMVNAVLSVNVPTFQTSVQSSQLPRHSYVPQLPL